MHDVTEIKPGIHWIGSEDPDLRTFDDLFPTEHGTTYNSFLIKGGDKIAVIDTVKGERAEEYLARVRSLVDPADIDYFIINHTEPDHSGSLAFMLQHCPKATVISSSRVPCARQLRNCHSRRRSLSLYSGLSGTTLPI